jgi:hypothetical protein
LPESRRAVTPFGVSLARNETGADRDVARTATNVLEEPSQLRRRMLSVCVESPAEAIVPLGCVAVAVRDRCRQAAVYRERQHLRASGARHVSRPVGRAVVDDEHVHAA